ncbi:MAG: hypothetical protein IJK31_06880 [Ruminococcus sp.]|nr:hypothetical protein [Ruminococcus sp.]
MVYSSLLFIYGFLPFSLLLYYITPNRQREKMLLLLSMLFCGAMGLCYLGLMLAYTVVNYTACRMIGKNRGKPAAAVPFAAAMIFDLAAILVFRTKYFIGSYSIIGWPEGIFPIGISFVTLAMLGTLIDVYNGRISEEKSIFRFALYVMFFPKLIMGPVLRYRSFSKALGSRRDGLNEIGIGISIFVKGLSKKVIVADNLYILYKAVRSVDPADMSAMTAWLGIAAFLLSLYFTMSGFSDMGVGLSHCFGMRLPQCFSYPLFRTKIRYFAARWHMQAMHWFRHYITKPLSSFSRSRIFRRCIYILSWGAFGFWYRFDMNGIVWGIILAAAIIVENCFSKHRLLAVTGVIYTFIITAFAAVFLACDSISDSLRYIFAMLGGNKMFADSLGFYLFRYYVVILLVAMYASTDLFRNMLIRSGKTRFRTVIAASAPLIVLAFAVLCTILLSYSGSSGMIIMKL